MGYSVSGSLGSYGKPVNEAINNITLTVNNTTGSIGIYRITGSIKIIGLYGIVTTVLSSNITAAHWRCEDGTNTPVISAASGTTLSAAAVGGMITRKGIVTAALIYNNATVTTVQDGNSAGNATWTEFDITQKVGANSDIVFRYTTTDAPSSGVIEHHLLWVPLSNNPSVTNL